MKSVLLHSLLLVSLGLTVAFPHNEEEAQAEAKAIARRLLKPVQRTMDVVDAKNANVGKETLKRFVNDTDQLPIRPSQFFSIREHPKTASTDSKKAKTLKDVPDDPHDVRMDKSLAHGQASKQRPTTLSVKQQEGKLKDAWVKYAEPPHSAQPMIAECAKVLQGARSEFANNKCSMEFHEHLESCLKAEPYCKFFDNGFVASTIDIEKQADTWCGKAECEKSVEQLEEIQHQCMKVASAQPANLLAYVKEAVPKFIPNWEQDGCFPKVCTTLQSQASQVNAAYIAYDKLGETYASYANTMKLEGLVLYDLYKVAGCKQPKK